MDTPYSQRVKEESAAEILLERFDKIRAKADDVFADAKARYKANADGGAQN
jgi:hypothetical protein